MTHSSSTKASIVALLAKLERQVEEDRPAPAQDDLVAETIADLLTLVPYEHLDAMKPVKLPPRQRRPYLRPPKSSEREVPTRYVVGSD